MRPEYRRYSLVVLQQLLLRHPIGRKQHTFGMRECERERRALSRGCGGCTTTGCTARGHRPCGAVATSCLRCPARGSGPSAFLCACGRAAFNRRCHINGTTATLRRVEYTVLVTRVRAFEHVQMVFELGQRFLRELPQVWIHAARYLRTIKRYGLAVMANLFG